MTVLFDAHNHLQDPRLLPFLPRIIEDLAAAGIERCVVNGTSEEDWPTVAALARDHPDLVIPSFGLHPWRASRRSPGWLDSLQHHLDHFARAGIGECGLDRWMKNPDLDDQREVFEAQLALAAERNLPISIHCLRAWGPLLASLRSRHLPARGILLHGYGGSPELVQELAPMGAWFSFAGAYLREKKEAVREAFRAVPPDRLLIETDAPDMQPPPSARPYHLADSEGAELNHPANLPAIARGLAAFLGREEQDLRVLLAGNFARFFLS